MGFAGSSGRRDYARAFIRRGPAPRVPLFRYDEDWSYLADSTPDGWWDRLKYIPLGRRGWFASLGGEVRERFELLDQPGVGTGPLDDNGYFLHRYLLSSDQHLGAPFRVFTELDSGLEQAVMETRGRPIATRLIYAGPSSIGRFFAPKRDPLRCASAGGSWVSEADA